jgi:hypothetical protein
MPRPEEMAWLIASDAFTSADGVPQDIVDDLQSMNLKHAADFTAYEDGSPMHPSWPAMHAAASVCSYWLPAIAKVTPEQYCEALRVDYAVAYARTVAGVHVSFSFTFPNEQLLLRLATPADNFFFVVFFFS